jgi:hypothetical protein
MPKISLSEEEMQLLCNREWILTKQRIIEKVYALFGSMSEKMQLQLQQNNRGIPVQALQLPPKISKGEQYEFLPYVVLDYPRLFSKENVFAIRTFFWWGNYFSITLHLKGIFLQQWFTSISNAANDKKWKGFYFSSEGNEFSFNLDGKNYGYDDGNGQAAAATKGQPAFLKISVKVSFAQWDTAEQKLMEVFERFTGLQSAG